MPEHISNNTSNVSVIKPIDLVSAHKITSGQVVIDLQTAVKELVENSLDAGATTIEVRFKNYGLDSIEVIDNGTGIPPADYDAVALKHHTSKLSSFTDLTSVSTFGFRGEALSSLCALSTSATVLTATASEAPMGTALEFDKQGRLTSKSGRAARQRGTTVTITGLFKPLPVRRKEFERNAKREFGKALHLLSAYALVPCAHENGGVRLLCSNQVPGGKKTVPLRTDGTPSTRASVSALWGPKTLEHLDTLDLCFKVETEKSVLRRLQNADYGKNTSNEIRVRGTVSKFALNCGRTSTDRQFFYVNGRPCQSSKVQKAFNEIYRTFNATQSPLIIADFLLPSDSLDINVSPDKRTIFIHSEDNLVTALKEALERQFSPGRSTYKVQPALQSHPDSQDSGNGDDSPARGSQRQENVEPSQVNTVVESDPLSVIHDVQVPEEGAVKDGSQAATPLFLPDVEEDAMQIQERDSGIQLTTLASIPQRSEADASPFGQPTLLFGGSSVAEVAETSADEMEDIDMNSRVPRAASPTDNYVHPPDMASPHSALSETSPVPNPPVREVYEVRARTSSGFSSAISERVSETETIHQIAPPQRYSSRSSGPFSTTVNRVSASSANSGAANKKRDVGQMVLNTSGAVWNLRLGDKDNEDREPQRKKPRTSDGASQAQAKPKGKESFRSLLAGYVRPGSQMQVRENSSDSSEDDQSLAELHGESLSSSNLDDIDAPIDDRSAGLPRNPSGTRPALPSSSSPGSTVIHAIDLAQTKADKPLTTPTRSSRRNASRAHSSGLEDVNMDETGDVPEVIKSGGRETVTMRYDEQAIEESWARLRQNHSTVSPSTLDAPAGGLYLIHEAGISNAEDSSRADEVLSRVIDKADFGSMGVIGQFNLGFIIVRRRKQVQSVDMDDLFIVDQHAADEKYNFETLQQTTKIESQKLFRPKFLELSASDELVALDNIDVLRQNGFEVVRTEQDAEDTHRPRLKLVAQPVSKNTVFDMRDLEELVHLLQDQPRGQMVRCSKARSMFAMRACRKSIMVGMPLTVKQMASVVRHMGAMDQPWNCPHGRPTMRHLSDISSLGRNRQKDRGLDWRAFSV